jgi:hypothetical protein
MSILAVEAEQIAVNDRLGRALKLETLDFFCAAGL